MGTQSSLVPIATSAELFSVSPYFLTHMGGLKMKLMRSTSERFQYVRQSLTVRATISSSILLACSVSKGSLIRLSFFADES